MILQAIGALVVGVGSHVIDLAMSNMAAKRGVKELNPLARKADGTLDFKKALIIKTAYVSGAIALGAATHQLVAAGLGMAIIGIILVIWNVIATWGSHTKVYTE